jgi:hypothetical protein
MDHADHNYRMDASIAGRGLTMLALGVAIGLVAGVIISATAGLIYLTHRNDQSRDLRSLF